MTHISINREAMKIVRKILDNPASIGALVSKLANGTTIIDLGQQAPGSWVAGRYYTQITMGGLGEFSYENFPYPINGMNLPAVRVIADFPLLACTASQIAGWRLEAGDFAPILAGPARALNSEPDHHFDYIDYRDDHHEAVIAIQTSEPVRPEWAELIARSCRVKAEDLYILVASNASLVCAVQVVARSVEQTIHRLEEEGLPLDTIFSAQGFGVLPSLTDDDLLAMGRINDSLLYGCEATFYLRHEDDVFVQELAQKVISQASPAYGRPFSEIFEEAGRDFYNIPLDLHSPAVVHLNNLTSGMTYSAGQVNTEMLNLSFFERTLPSP